MLLSYDNNILLIIYYGFNIYVISTIDIIMNTSSDSKSTRKDRN